MVVIPVIFVCVTSINVHSLASVLSLFFPQIYWCCIVDSTVFRDTASLKMRVLQLDLSKVLFEKLSSPQ